MAPATVSTQKCPQRSPSLHRMWWIFTLLVQHAEIAGPFAAGLVLPVIGALPDSIIILVAGLHGSEAVAHEQVRFKGSALACAVLKQASNVLPVIGTNSRFHHHLSPGLHGSGLRLPVEACVACLEDIA